VRTGVPAPAVAPAVPVGEPASFGSRVVAAVIDGVALTIPAFVLAIVIFGGIGAAAGGGEDEDVVATAIGTALYFALLFAVALLYAPVLMARAGPNNGQTIGKQMLGIRVVRENGEPMTFRTAAIREALVKYFAVGVAASFSFGLLGLLNYLWPLWDDDNQALHDVIASTRVVTAEGR
jgi:uncharacterized RDD family membrane protein YckC